MAKLLLRNSRSFLEAYDLTDENEAEYRDKLYEIDRKLNTSADNPDWDELLVEIQKISIELLEEFYEMIQIDKVLEELKKESFEKVSDSVLDEIADENVSDSELKYVHFVSHDDAWLRMPGSPEKFIEPTERAVLGTQVALLGLAAKDKSAILKIHGSGDTIYISNKPEYLAKIVKLSEELRYKLVDDFEALKLPYSIEWAGKTYKKDGEYLVFNRQCGSYFKVAEIGDDILGHWIVAELLRSEAFYQLLSLMETKDKMSVDEIMVVRVQIKELNIKAEKEELYIELQALSPYADQRDNEAPATEEDLQSHSWMTTYNISTAGEIMCNLTSQAMGLSYLGVDKPCSDCPDSCDTKYEQMEDYLECLRVANGFDDRTKGETRKDLADLFEVEYKYLEFIESTKSEIINDMQAELDKGHSVILGGFGHMVRLQSVSGDGVIVDDPYGKMVNFTAGGVTAKYKEDGKDYRNGKGLGDELGNDNLWTWDQFMNQLKVLYGEVYSKN